MMFQQPFIPTEKMIMERDFVNGSIVIGKGTILEPYCAIYPRCVIGEKCIIGTHAVLKEDTRVGDHSIIGTLTATEGNCSIGSWTTIHSQCHITEGLHIGNNVFIAPFFISTNTPVLGKGRFGYPNTTNHPRFESYIHDGVRIGANVSIVPNITIGKDALIDMCCLITSDVPAGAHMRGDTSYVARYHEAIPNIDEESQ